MYLETGHGTWPKKVEEVVDTHARSFTSWSTALALDRSVYIVSWFVGSQNVPRQTPFYLYSARDSPKWIEPRSQILE